MSNTATQCVRESSELSANFAILQTFKVMPLIKSKPEKRIQAPGCCKTRLRGKRKA
jgi:hypothetical protein